MHILKILFLFVITSNYASAAELKTHTGNVLEIVTFPQTYGAYNENAKVMFAIYIEGLPKGCGSGFNRVIISKDHPLHDSVVTIAILARTTGKQIKVGYFNECTLRPESWDLGFIELKH